MCVIPRTADGQHHHHLTITGIVGTFRKSLVLVHSWSSFLYCNLITGIGKSFLGKFKEAVAMKSKHENIFKQFMATFLLTVIQNWMAMVEKWELNPSKAKNPYKEPQACESASR